MYQDNNKTIQQSNNLFSSIYTKQDLQLFYKEIDQVKASLFEGPGSLQEKLSAVFNPEKTEEILTFINLEKIRVDSPVFIQEGLEKIKTLGDLLPVISLELAFEPTENVLKKIDTWLMQNIGKKVLVNISLERRDIGGTNISFNGVYKNYTLRNKINEAFEKKNYI